MNNSSDITVSTAADVSSVSELWKKIYYWIGIVFFFNFFLGIVGNIICILALRVQLKASKGYYHQLTLMILETFGCISSILGEVGYLFLGIWQNKPTYIQSTYFVVVSIKSYCFRSLIEAARIALLCGVGVDRLSALRQPIMYQKVFRHKLRAVILALGSLAIGTLLHCVCFVLLGTEWNSKTSTYDVVVVKMGTAGGWEKVHLMLGFVTQISQVVLAAILLVIMVVLALTYKKAMRAHEQLAENTRNNYSEGEKPVDQRTLTMFLLSQGAMILSKNMVNIIYRAVLQLFMFPRSSYTFQVVDAAKQIMNSVSLSWNFLVYLGISKNFRNVVKGIFFKENQSAIAPAQNIGQANTGKGR